MKKMTQDQIDKRDKDMKEYSYKACYVGYGMKCIFLAVLLYEIEPKSTLIEKALVMSCDLNEVLACDMLTDAYSNGKGSIKKDNNKAKEYKRKTQKLGSVRY